MLSVMHCHHIKASNRRVGSLQMTHIGDSWVILKQNRRRSPVGVACMPTNTTSGRRKVLTLPAAMTALANSFLPTLGHRAPGRFFYGRVGVKF